MLVFLEAILHSTNTFFAVSRPVVIDQTDIYVNKVAPTARIYLHLICRKRHLPLKLRKGKTMTKPRLRTITLTAAVGAASGTDKSVPYERPLAAAES